MYTTKSGLILGFHGCDEKIAIEIDGEVIPKSSHNNFFIKPNMKIEIITFVGGG